MRSFLLNLLFFSICLLQCVAAAQESVDFEVSRECTIDRDIGGYLSIKTHLGNLPFNATGRVRLTVHNPFSEDIDFGSYFAGCTCLKTTLSSTLLKSGSSIDINFTLTTPRKTNRAQQIAAVAIAKGKEPGAERVNVAMEYDISGLVTFRDDVVAASALPGDKLLTFRIPIVVAEPAQWQNIVCRGTGALKSVSLRVVPDQQNPYVEGQIETDKLGDHGITGELLIEDKESQIQNATLCTLAITPEIAVAPLPLRLIWNAPEQCFQCSCIVQFNATKANDGTADSRKFATLKDVKFRATTKGAKIDVTTTELSNGVFRLHLSISPFGTNQEFRDLENPDGILLALTAGRKDYVRKCALHFVR